jgi:hypothetical protein
LARPTITYKRLVLDLVQELRLTAAELERGLAEGKSPEELLATVERRHAIHSGLSLRTARKLRDASRPAGDS